MSVLPVILLAAVGCSDQLMPDAAVPPPTSARVSPEVAAPETPNILIVLIRDISVDQVSFYEAHPDQPPLPRLEAFANTGVRYEWAYSQSSSSASLASVLTGRSPMRTGIVSRVDGPTEPRSLPLSEVILPEMLRQAVAESLASLGRNHPRFVDHLLLDRHEAGALHDL